MVKVKVIRDEKPALICAKYNIIYKEKQSLWNQ